MAEANTSFLSELLTELRQVWSTAIYGLSGIGLWARNLIRRLRGSRTDYVVIPISGTLPERSGPPRGFLQRRLPLPAQPLSMALLNRRLRAVADADNVKGVIFVFQGLSIGLATCQSLRRSIARLRAAGKETVVFTPYLDLAHYYAAAAAERIVVPPMTRFELIGMRIESIFLKDALDRLGIHADVVQISPFKTAFNELSQNQMPPEQEQQLNWILDDAFDQISSDIARDRRLDPERFRVLVDEAPHSAVDALVAGLIDDIAYEDALPFLLARPLPGPDTRQGPDGASYEGGQPSPKQPGPKARLSSWPEARGLMLERRRRPARKYIGVVSLEGNIAMGPSRSAPLPIPLFSGTAAGERTLTALLRRAEKDRRMAALIIHIDSGGGSALASDLIWRQLQRMAKRLPVVAYMGNMAASGGYYIAAACKRIVAQPMTLTGSIGVVNVHISTGGLFEKLDVNRVSLQRGRRANLASDLAPLTEEERQIVWAEITEAYQRFMDVVAAGRDLAPESLDRICEGRVWTGRQARDNGLLDDHGDFQDTIGIAASLAGLPLDDLNDVPVYDLFPTGSAHVLPKALEEPVELLKLMTFEGLDQLNGKPLFIIPVDITLR